MPWLGPRQSVRRVAADSCVDRLLRRYGVLVGGEQYPETMPKVADRGSVGRPNLVTPEALSQPTPRVGGGTRGKGLTRVLELELKKVGAAARRLPADGDGPRSRSHTWTLGVMQNE